MKRDRSKRAIFYLPDIERSSKMYSSIRLYKKKIGSSTFSVVHCGGDVEFTDGEVEHGD